MLRRLWLLDKIDELINPATEEKQDDTISALNNIFSSSSDGSQKTQVVDNSSNPVGFVSTESGLAMIVYQAARGDSGYIHFHIENLSTGIYNFILIDISDTVNYNHSETNYAHEEVREISVTSDVNGDWKISFGFLEDVTDTGSKLYVVNHWQGSKDTGNNLQDSVNLFPAGPHMTSEKFTTHQSGVTSNYQSDVLLPSTLDPNNPTVYPGNGDVVLTVEITAGNIKELKINIGYHSH